MRETMHRWTPGPWQVVGFPSGTARKTGQICNASGVAAIYFEHDGTDEGKANIDLAAAAPRLFEAAELGASMLAYEATCHEESGDAKRRTYVGPIRDAVERIRRILASVDPK